jgi:hypothetical protein
LWSVEVVFHFGQSPVHSPQGQGKSCKDDERDTRHDVGFATAKKETFHGRGKEVEEQGHLH